MANNIYQAMRVAKDECYTTTAEADKLVLYLLANDLVKKDMRIWLPFDTDLSRIYLALIKFGFTNVNYQAWKTDKTFIIMNLTNGIWLLANPPFSGRTKLLQRLYSFDKPFIILQGTQFFNNQNAVDLLSLYAQEISFLMPQSRMKFMVYDEDEDVVKADKSGIAFYSFWFCYKINNPLTFNLLLDTGEEKRVEVMNLMGNAVKDRYLNLFNWENEENEE